MKGVINRSKGHGVKPLSEEPVEVRRDVCALYPLDPEGNLVEFVEDLDVSGYRPDLFKRQQSRKENRVILLFQGLQFPHLNAVLGVLDECSPVVP